MLLACCAHAAATPPRSRLPAAGFTLVEAVVACAVLALTLRLAVPALADLTHNTRLRSHASSLLSTLHLARSEAIRRNGRVTLCKSSDGQRCAGHGGWEQGLIVFEDVNRNGEREDSETIIHQDVALPASYRATGNGSVRDHISYTPLGVAHTPSGAFQAGTISICRSHSGPTEAWQVVVNAGGRPRTQKQGVATCP